MTDDVNPYRAPMSPVAKDCRADHYAASLHRELSSLVHLIRFAGSIICTFFACLQLNGTYVNWANVGPIVLVALLMVAATHAWTFFAFRKQKSKSFAPLASYLAGIALTVAMFLLGWYPAGL